MAEHLDSIAYCSAPFSAPVVNAAIDAYHESHDQLSRVSGSKDRIFILKSTPCVPMFAYGLVDNNYEKYRGASNVNGKHLYEGVAADPRNWQADLPNLRPCSIYQHIDWVDKEKADDIEIYGKAEREYGFVHQSVNDTGIETGTYYIWRTPNYQPKVEELRKLVKEAQALTAAEVSDNNAKEMLKKITDATEALKKQTETLRDYRQRLVDYQFVYETDPVTNTQRMVRPEVPPVRIRDDGDHSTEDSAFTVRRDRVLAYPKLMKDVRDEVKKEEMYRTVIADAEAAVKALDGKAGEIGNVVGVREQELPNFIDGLFSGVIGYSKGHIIRFEDKDEFGIENSPTVELSKPADKPFGAKAPLYQAFNTFCDLPKESRDRICAKISQRLNGVDENDLPKDWSDEMRAACDMLDAIVTADYVQTIALMNKGTPDYGTIMNVYKTFMTVQKTFRVLHGL